jgi:hypothetical protein
MDLKTTVIGRGFLTMNELEKIAYWKAPRSAGHAQKNDEDYVTEITRIKMNKYPLGEFQIRAYHATS